jgi:hypothetical protein
MNNNYRTLAEYLHNISEQLAGNIREEEAQKASLKSTEKGLGELLTEKLVSAITEDRYDDALKVLAIIDNLPTCPKE